MTNRPFSELQADLRTSQRVTLLDTVEPPPEWHRLPVEPMPAPSYGIPWAPIVVVLGIVAAVVGWLAR